MRIFVFLIYKVKHLLMNRNLKSNKFNTLAFGNEQVARAQRPLFIKLNQNWRLKHLVNFVFFISTRFIGNKSITFFRVELD